MGIRIKKNPVNSINNFTDRLVRKIQSAHDKSAQFMSDQIDLSFEKQGDRGSGTFKWEPTTFIAKQHRKTYPKNKAGQKGLSQQQLSYLRRTDDTLKDTGALQNSKTIENELEERGLIKRTYTGTGKPYIKTHEEGDTITVEGATYDVPERPSHFITDNEADKIENMFLEALR